MINGKKVVVVLPAYNAEKTLEETYKNISKEFVDDILLIDDFSNDNTKILSKKLGIKTIIHEKNKGYGANQKTCYTAALQTEADIVIMLHPDYQYTPKLIPAIASMLAFDEFDAVIASRMLSGNALQNGMPLYKWLSNKALTLFQNIITNKHLSEYHTGYRGFSRKVLETLPLEACNDDFVFDNEMLTLIIYNNFKIGEISCSAKYFKEASSINFLRSCKYGLGVIKTCLFYFLAKTNLFKSKIFKPDAQKININKELNYFHR